MSINVHFIIFCIIYNYKYIKRQKMLSSTGPLPRNIRFNQQGIRNFVQGSSFLNTAHIPKQNYNNGNYNMAHTYNNLQIKVMGFDAYFKNNLLLKAVNVEDIQYVQKNPVVYQQDLHVISQLPKSNKNIHVQDKKENAKAKTSKDFYKVQNVEEEQNKQSKEAQFNEFLFNYRKQQEEKKNKKMKFLSEIQQRINNLEKQTYNMSIDKQRQYEQLNGILKIQQNTTKIAAKADLVGKLNNAIHQADCYNNLNLSPPKKITEDMEFLQINAAIEEHHNYNNALLDQIERVSRSKSKDRVKAKQGSSFKLSPGKAGMKKTSDNFHSNPSSMSKTLRRPMQVPPRPTSSKKLTATWKSKPKI